MGTVATMNVSLPDDLVEFVRAETKTGGYGNQSDVVRDGLRLLREHKRKRQVLLKLLDEGLAASAAGNTKSLTDKAIHEIANRARERSRKRQGGR